MKRILPILFALVLLFTASLVQAQQMPVTTTSDAARAYFEQGRLAAAHVQFDRARTHFDAALVADPEFALAHLYRAFLSPVEEREAHLQQATARADEVSDGERMMIESLAARMSEDYDREIDLLNQIAKRYPDDPHIPFLTGWRHYAQERYDEAAAAAERVLAADPEFAPAYNMLGYIALNQEDYAAAEKALKTYVRLAPDEANPYDSLGELYLTMGRYDEAATQFEMALARDPDFTVSRNNLVRVSIEKANRKFEAAFSRQDADALTDLYTANALLFPPGSEPVSGRDAIREFWAGLFASGVDGVDLTTREVQSMGDLAYELGTATPRTGSEVVDEVRYTVIWRKDGDTWKLHRDLWNSSKAPPAPTAAKDE